MKKRVVVTGLGAITPIGNTVNEFWEAMKNNVNGIDKITLFDTDEFTVKLAAEIKNYVAEEHFDKKTVRRMDRYTQFALIAAKEAIKDSNVDLEKVNKERCGVYFGAGIGGIITIENEMNKLMNKGPKRVSPFAIPMSISNIAAGSIAIEHGLLGSCIGLVSACATSTHSIGEAYRNIRDGYSDLIVAGGAEASICPFAIAGFQSLSALSKKEDKNRASIPFDAERDGFVMGEGAGAIILETLESALNRNAKIYAEVVGYGTTCDAYHITSPSLDGSGAARAMVDAINDAGISSNDLDYINAHGTSTSLNDKCETIAIKKALGEDAYKPYVSSTKSMTGHLLGAAGAIEAIASIKAIEEKFVPANINFEHKDEECDLNLINNSGKFDTELKYVMSNSLGFGGHNGTLIFKKWEG